MDLIRVLIKENSVSLIRTLMWFITCYLVMKKVDMKRGSIYIYVYIRISMDIATNRPNPPSGPIRWKHSLQYREIAHLLKLVEGKEHSTSCCCKMQPNTKLCMICLFFSCSRTILSLHSAKYNSIWKRVPQSWWLFVVTIMRTGSYWGWSF